MSQSVRQAARRAALDVRSRRQRERAEGEKRLEGLVVDVLVALGERADAERRAGVALEAMVETEGLSAREAVDWCDGQVSTREAARLRAVARDAAAEEADGAGDGVAGSSSSAVEPVRADAGPTAER